MVFEITVPILETLEPWIEFLNVILAVLIVVYGVKSYFLLEGKLKRAWGYFLGAICLFGIHEIIGTLEELQIFDMTALYAISELIFIAAFLLAAITFVNLFRVIAQSKKK